jgi:hypothetical protein
MLRMLRMLGMLGMLRMRTTWIRWLLLGAYRLSRIWSLVWLILPRRRVGSSIWRSEVGSRGTLMGLISILIRMRW